MERKEKTKKKGWSKMRRGREKLVAIPICKKERDKDILYYVKKKGKKKEKRRRKTSTDDCRADIN